MILINKLSQENTATCSISLIFNFEKSLKLQRVGSPHFNLVLPQRFPDVLCMETQREDTSCQDRTEDKCQK